MKRARDDAAVDSKDANPRATKRRIMHDMREGAELDSSGVLGELLIPAAARAAAAVEVEGRTDLVIPNADRKLPWTPSGQSDLNLSLLDYMQTLFDVIDRWLNQGVCPDSVRWSGGRGPLLHLQFLRDWLVNCYVPYRDSGRGTMSTSALMWYARARLYYAQHRLERFPDGNALEKCSEQTWREHAWKLFFDCVHGCVHSKIEWMRRLDALERESVIVTTYTSNRKLCEDIAANYAWMQLQWEYLFGVPDMADDEKTALLDSVKEVRQRVRAYVDSVIKRQISDVLDGMWTDFVHGQYLACGLVDVFMRENESTAARVPMSALLNDTLKVKDREKMQNMLAENPADISADEKHVLNGLLRFVGMAYCIEQQYGIKWLSKYFISNKDFNVKHQELRQKRRGLLRDRRPTVCFVLGRACVFYRGTHKVVADTPEDAFLLWFALIKRDYQCKLEYGSPLEDFGQS